MSSGAGARVRIALGGSSGSGSRPAPLAVEGDLVLVAAAGLEALEPDQRVVMARDRRWARCGRGSRPRRAASVSTQTVASVSET